MPVLITLGQSAAIILFYDHRHSLCFNWLFPLLKQILSVENWLVYANRRIDASMWLLVVAYTQLINRGATVYQGKMPGIIRFVHLIFISELKFDALQTFSTPQLLSLVLPTDQ